MLTLKKSEVNKLDLTELMPHICGADAPNFNQRAGQEWYKLLAYISASLHNVNIIDIGSRHGASAVALGYNPENGVWSYDIKNWHPKCTLENVEFMIENLLDGDMELIDHADVITIDVEPHDGIKERQFLDKIRARDWKGILILDDIGPAWPETQKMWNEIPEIKYDVTDIGHASGTGVVDFSGELVIK